VKGVRRWRSRNKEPEIKKKILSYLHANLVLSEKYLQIPKQMIKAGGDVRAFRRCQPFGIKR
jgi:hypothetical protein